MDPLSATLIQLLFTVPVLSPVAVIYGVKFGVGAWRKRSEVSDPKLRGLLLLVALNMFEPFVTTVVLLIAVGIMTVSSNRFGMVAVLSCTAIPLTTMLLAPLVARVRHPGVRLVMVYGLLRFVHTIAF